MSSRKRIKKIKTEAKATPVASFRERYRDRSKQTTLTQLLGSSDSDTVDFADNRKRSAKRTPPQKRRKMWIFSNQVMHLIQLLSQQLLSLPPKKMFKSKDKA